MAEKNFCPHLRGCRTRKAELSKKLKVREPDRNPRRDLDVDSKPGIRAWGSEVGG